MKINIYVPYAFVEKVHVDIIPCAYVPRHNFFIQPEKTPDVLEHIRTIRAAEDDRNDWIRRYENALQGLNYWKARALENE